MKVLQADFNGGWFIGNFEPALLKTPDYEVGYKLHIKGEEWPKHYHQHCTEYNYLVSGTMQLMGQTLVGPVGFIIEPYEIADPVFVTDCHLIVVKSQSNPGDKVIVR